MAGRQLVFADGEYYQIFNRGIARQPTFFSKRDYERFLLTLSYYRFLDVPGKLSRYLSLPQDTRLQIMRSLEKSQKSIVEIVCFALMPNHFHLLLKQTNEGGITKFMSKTINSYTKYVNTKQDRVGDLFQGVFKAVRVETNEQLIHLSRYIHLNPVVSRVVSEHELIQYPWSSFAQYIQTPTFVSNTIVMNQFKTKQAYKDFVFNQIEYGKRLEEIKHLIIER